MPTLIELEDMQDGYAFLCNFVLGNGRRTSPRGIETYELEDVTFTVDDLRDTLPTRVGRSPNLMIAALESLQLMSGVATPELIVAASSAFAKFREESGEFWGAYGDRIGTQGEEVVRKLRSDAESRQAVITLWRADRDNTDGKKDYPCTIALGFRLRNDRLNASVTMRSNDVWLGTCYDVFQFTQLQHTLANELQVELGTYTHTAWSLHLYETDLDKIEKLHGHEGGSSFVPAGLPKIDVARDLLLRQTYNVERTTADERWYDELVTKVYERMSSAPTDVG